MCVGVRGNELVLACVVCVLATLCGNECVLACMLMSVCWSAPQCVNVCVGVHGCECVLTCVVMSVCWLAMHCVAGWCTQHHITP